MLLKHYWRKRCETACACGHISLVALGKESADPETRGSVSARLYSAGPDSPQPSAGLADGGGGPLCISIQFNTFETVTVWLSGD